MYMRFNPYHGGLLAERLTLDEFRSKYTLAKLWEFDPFTGALIPLAITKDDPFGYTQVVPDTLPKFINADIRIVSVEPDKTKRRVAITLEALSEELFAPCKRLSNFAYDFDDFTFTQMWKRGAQVFMDSWDSIGQVATDAKNRVGSGSNGWITVGQQGDNRTYIFTQAFTESSIRKTDLLTVWRMGCLRINTQVGYDDDGRITDIKRLNLRLGLPNGGSGLDVCEEKYYNPPLPEVN